MSVVKLESVSLKNSTTFKEKWVQDQIAEAPTILGLGDLELKDKERRHAGAGRLDLLLQDLETLKRYEVEIQLGPTDETHIIRTIEYWDIERKRYPQYEHAAVIVAEEITSRFLNVIQLFNGSIPLIALKMTAYRVNEQIALTFVKVLDENTFGLVDDDEPISEPTTRAYWETKATPASLRVTDDLLGLVKQKVSNAELNFNKHYIGIKIDGVVRNFISFQPRKQHVIMQFKLPPQADEEKAMLADAGIETLTYDSQFGNFRVKMNAAANAKQTEPLIALIARAWEGFGK